VGFQGAQKHGLKRCPKVGKNGSRPTPQIQKTPIYRQILFRKTDKKGVANPPKKGVANPPKKGVANPVPDAQT
jgi:hypothetical protein